MERKYFFIVFLSAAAFFSCSSAEDAQQLEKHPDSTIIIKPKQKIMTIAQKTELGFSSDVYTLVEKTAGASAEPFFEDVMIKTANLKGDAMIVAGRLSGFSVRTRDADRLIDELSPALRAKGFLIFRSEQNFGSVPDVVTVIRGENSYDILKIQKTEAPHYHLDTKAIISWLRQQQKEASFVITGAGADWVEARFTKPPRNIKSFAWKVSSFSPDVLREGHGTIDRLADWMGSTNSFRLVWD